VAYYLLLYNDRGEMRVLRGVLHISHEESLDHTPQSEVCNEEKKLSHFTLKVRDKM